jgi:hypothetical protein
MNEDMDEMAVAEPLAGEELERVLARYARLRLDPSQAQARRARAAVMEEAWRRRIGPMDASPARPARRGLFAAWSGRRVAASLSAALLAGLLLGTSAFAASRAGGPLYEPRLALESLALPTGADARVDAVLAQAQARLAEAVEAAGRHDDPATAAALAAYDRAIEGLAGAQGASAARALESVQFHRSVLLEVAADAPGGAANGLAEALQRSGHVIDVLAAAGPGTPGGAGNGGSGSGGANPGANPGANGGPGGSAGGRPTPRPEATAKPTRTAKPGKTPAPAAAESPSPTVKPGRTPAPHKTPPGKSDAEQP